MKQETKSLTRLLEILMVQERTNVELGHQVNLMKYNYSRSGSTLHSCDMLYDQARIQWGCGAACPIAFDQWDARVVVLFKKIGLYWDKF